MTRRLQENKPNELKQDELPNKLLGSNPKDLLGIKKVRLSLVPPASTIYQAKAMELGAAKYGPYNWRSNKVVSSIYVDAALRHLQSWFDGEEDAIELITMDDGSVVEHRVPHLGAALACLGILADAIETGNLIDDRPVHGVAAQLIEKFKKKEDK